MATWPAKINYATGDVLTAAQMNDIGGELNDLYTSSGFAAGKNKILNGDFGIWQRGTSFNYTGSAATTYTADRFAVYVNGNGTYTISQQTFTAGTAPVAGYEGQYFCRFATNTVGTSTQAIAFDQRIEDVRTFAGQTITVSFWAKADSARNITPYIAQNFGSGVSATVQTSLGTTGITTSWVRYSFTTTLASISGKTIGTSSYLNFYISLTPAASQTIDIWGVQVEAGSVATPFQTATGTKQGELAACQRYYWRAVSGGSYGLLGISGYVVNSTTANINVNYPVFMRTIPTSVDYSTLTIQDSAASLYAVSAASINTDITNNYAAGLNITISGATSGRWARMLANNSTNAYIGFSAEL